MSYFVGTISGMYTEEGTEDLVLKSVGITTVVFVALTVYTLTYKHNFLFLDAGLGVGFLIMIIWGSLIWYLA